MRRWTPCSWPGRRPARRRGRLGTAGRADEPSRISLASAGQRVVGGTWRKAALHPLQDHGLGGRRPDGPLGHRVRPARPRAALGRAARADPSGCAGQRVRTPSRNTFTQAYGSPALDASLLLIPRLGFLPATDPRVLGTIAAVRRELTDGGLVRRYQTTQTNDGVKGSEGLFIACSFWLVDALCAAGDRRAATGLFERLLRLRNDVGLLSEEWDPAAQRQLGNTPQAFSHFGLIVSALQLHMGARGPQRQPDAAAAMTLAPTTPGVVIDRLTLIVSDLDRAEDDYVTTVRVHRRTADRHRVRADPGAVHRPRRGRRFIVAAGPGADRAAGVLRCGGARLPTDSTSTDLWFQHLAIVVDDMTAAYQQVMANPRFRPISRNGPVQLPASSGGRDSRSSSVITTATRWSCWPSPRELARRNGGRRAARAASLALTTPRSRSATYPAARDSSAPSSGSAPEPAPRTAVRSRRLSTTSRTSR